MNNLQQFLLELGKGFAFVARQKRIEESKHIFASKYMLYMPTEEELKREINKDREILEIEERINEDE